MQAPDVAVAGGGPAGLSAALALARAGARVIVVDREGFAACTPAEALAAPRTGIAHYHAPHAFLPRGAKVLRERLPDVYSALLELGAFELPIARELPDSRPDDAELILLCVRRPLIEWALRDAVLREPGIAVRAASVDGLVTEGAAVRGLATSDGEVRAPLVVDALGRSSRSAGALGVQEESHEVGVVYYGRYYRLHDDAELPSFSHPYGPRVDLGFAVCATFLGDNRTFAFAWMVPAWDRELKRLRHADAHHAACTAVPELRAWVEPSTSRPVTGVVSMGALRTTWRAYDRVAPEGFVAVGDAFCHTDPTFALGLSAGLVHACALADDPGGYWEAVTPEARERFELARDVSTAHLAKLRGERPEPSEAAATFAALSAAARRDPALFRVAFRRSGFLDRLGPLDLDVPARAPSPPPPLGRDELLAALG